MKELTTDYITLIALVENKPGVLYRVAGLFRRRNYNIESLTVGHSEAPGISRMTIVLERRADQAVQQIVEQLNKLINVTYVEDVTEKSTVFREMALIKVRATPGKRSEIVELANIFRGRVVDVGNTTMTIEVTGPETRVNSLIGLLEPYKIEELARTGLVAMVRAGNESLL